MTTQFIGIKEFRQNISTLTRTARRQGTRFIILNKNKPMLDVRPISNEDATLEQLAYDIERAREDVRAGRLYTLNELKKDLGL